jgi:hypothetical protein
MRSFVNEPRPPGAPGRSGRDWTIVGVFAALAVLEGYTLAYLLLLPYSLVRWGPVVRSWPARWSRPP